MSDHAKENAQAWWETIKEQVAALNAAQEAQDDEAFEKAQETILESALSIEVRDGWHAPGSTGEPEEYNVLLSTGGPALRIYGGLDQHNQPDLDPMLQWQDWGTPWTDYWPPDSNDIPYKDTLCQWLEPFYFGD